MFVFAFFLIRRIASRSGEGKKECEEERDTFHGKFLEVVGITVPVLFSLCQ